jgi:GR25 family glycosyltransferase involved in LPS biosynthesis
MKVGITVDIRHSMFSAGHPNACLAVAEVFQIGENEVVFLKRERDKTWWDDVKSLESSFPKIVDIENIEGIDLVIEIGFLLSPLERSRISKTIWYCRKSIIFNDIESSVFGSKPDGRDLEGLSEIWVADIFNLQDDINYLKTLYPSIFIKMVPWVWTPTIVEAHRKEINSPVWVQVKETLTDDKKWSLHISETNASNTSSCTLPILMLENIKIDNIEKIHVHNTNNLEDNQFFKENILNNCKVKNKKFVGRQRIVEWASEPNSIILSHSRFIQLKLANLEAVWVGIPLVHNNKILKELECGLELTYYENNKIEDAVRVFDRIISKYESIPYLHSVNALTELRNKILYKFSPEAHAQEWLSLLNVKKVNRKYSILFTDMWDQFNEAHNMFTLAFANELNVVVDGYSTKTLPLGLVHDIHIFGPFGSVWKGYKGPKIHFTGENTEQINDTSVKLNIGFKHLNDPRYLRMPHWMFSIDWFNCNPSLIRNPIPIPVKACTESFIGERKKFCAFVVTNPCNPVRNDAFHTLNEYKPVDSAGRLFNTMGDTIFAGLGGGGGERMKVEFLKDYRFCLAYENQSSDGYVTEKLLHAKAAGCVPIYWGDPSVVKDFDENGFINLTGSPETLVERVRELEEDPEKWLKMASVPALTEKKVEEVLGLFSEMVKRAISGTLLVTFSTQKFWPSLIRWLDTVKLYNESIGVMVRVYIGSDVIENMLEKIKGDYKFASFIRVPNETPSGFEDFWAPSNYAWKLWIYKELSEDPILKGNLVFYSDCGSVLIRWPTEWFQKVMEHKICLLEDSSQINLHWCHSKFCNILEVTKEELSKNQIVGGIMAFVSGDSKVVKFLSDAYKFGCNRDIIVGEKWEGIGKDGKPFGHRHDQSILSILSERSKLERFPLEKIYNHDSARSTYFNGQCIYVHRGEYKTHLPILEGIDETYLINLDRRVDRKMSFLEHHPYMKGKVRRHVACDGRNLCLTPELARLFKPNDFFWKKAVMGCALSHLKLWKMLVNDSKEIQSYLILEDDVRLQAGWKEAWANVYSKLPVDWECIYLGGILPPNKEGFKNVLEPVIPGLSRIAPNTFFGQVEPTRQFHFCAYSYVLSRKGASKILKAIEERGYWTSADHMLFNPLDKINVYVLDPLVAGASQDDDPAYLNSDFNDFSRIDKFDSDLWNNDERFSPEEVETCLKKEVSLNINGTVDNVYRQITMPIIKKETRYVSLYKLNNTIYEKLWLEDLLGSNFTIEQISKDTKLDSCNNLVVILVRPNWVEQLEWLDNLQKAGIKFKVIHLSDELHEDPCFFYSRSEVKSVLRFYHRNNLPNEKVLTIPLGYHWKVKGSIKPINERKYSWSFCGTNWKGRSEQLSALEKIEPKLLTYYPDWNDSSQLKESEYISLLQNTIFVPCPRGNNIETYRFYEAIESGCIPVFTELPEILLESGIPFLRTSTWEEVAELIKHFLKNRIQLDSYHKSIYNGWLRYKKQLQTNMQAWL